MIRGSFRPAPVLSYCLMTETAEVKKSFDQLPRSYRSPPSAPPSSSPQSRLVPRAREALEWPSSAKLSRGWCVRARQTATLRRGLKNGPSSPATFEPLRISFSIGLSPLARGLSPCGSQPSPGLTRGAPFPPASADERASSNALLIIGTLKRRLHDNGEASASTTYTSVLISFVPTHNYPTLLLFHSQTACVSSVLIHLHRGRTSLPLVG